MATKMELVELQFFKENRKHARTKVTQKCMFVSSNIENFRSNSAMMKS